MKKWIFPICAFAFSFLIYVLITDVLIDFFDNYGGIYAIALCIVLWLGVINPLIAFIYSRKCLCEVSMGYKYVFAVLNSIALALPLCLIINYNNKMAVMICLGELLWCVYWTHLGFIQKKPKASADVLIGQDQA